MYFSFYIFLSCFAAITDFKVVTFDPEAPGNVSVIFY